MKHTMMTGHEIEYEEPTGELAKLLTRLAKMAADPKVTEDDMIELAYNEDNPLLAPGIIPGRGMVTKATLDRPEYRLILDLLDRKRVAKMGVPIEELARAYTLTVADAARELGVHESAIRQAIASFRLSSWIKDRKHYLHPRAVESYAETMRMRSPAESTTIGNPLEVWMGTRAGSGLHVKSDGSWVPAVVGARGPAGRGRFVNWHRAAVIFGEDAKQRFFEIEPSDEAGELKWGDFSVTGKFKIARKENNGKRAVDAWKAWPKATAAE